MKNSRSQVIAQIARVNRELQEQKSKIIQHKEYFAKKSIYGDYLKAISFLITGFYIGWGIERKYVNKNLAKYAVNVEPVLLGVSTSAVWNLMCGALVYLFRVFYKHIEKSQ